MSRLDYCHSQIVHALEKEGWVVQDAPFSIRVPERRIYIDIEASRQANGKRQQILLAEVKCFPDPKSTTTDLYTAFGQYIIYRAVLAEARIPISLYLAVPENIFQSVFDTTVHRAIRDNLIKLLLVQLETETIVRWIE